METIGKINAKSKRELYKKKVQSHHVEQKPSINKQIPDINQRDFKRNLLEESKNEAYSNIERLDSISEDISSSIIHNHELNSKAMDILFEKLKNYDSYVHYFLSYRVK